MLAPDDEPANKSTDNEEQKACGRMILGHVKSRKATLTGEVGKKKTHHARQVTMGGPEGGRLPEQSKQGRQGLASAGERAPGSVEKNPRHLTQAPVHCS